VSNPAFIREVKTIESSTEPIKGNRNYDYNEIKALSSIKINRFMETSSFIFRLDKIFSKATNSRKRSFFQNLKLMKLNLLKNRDPRAEKLVKFSFMKRIMSHRPLDMRRAFLRWKAVIDTDLQATCVTRFAVYARINHAVAIYRFKWLLEQARMRRESERRDNMKKKMRDFMARIDKIQREIYSNKNQLEHAFRKIKNPWMYDQKVIGFGKKLQRLLDPSKDMKAALDRVKKIAFLKSSLVRKLVDKTDGKMRRGFAKLRDFNLRALLEKSRLL
jgi:hypothetical protein